MHTSIENVTLRDVPRIAEVERVCLPYDYWNEKSIEYAIHHTEDESYRYVFLKASDEDGTLMGYIVATLVAEDCEVHSVAVDTPYRRNRIAERLFSRLESVARGTASSIYLEVRKSNLPAQSLYRKLGFQTVGERRHYYDYPREDAILMAKPLRD